MIVKTKKQKGTSTVEYVILLGGLALTIMVSGVLLGKNASTTFGTAATSGFSSSSYNGGNQDPPGYNGSHNGGEHYSYGGHSYTYHSGSHQWN